jgi:heme/copper-type cytochrome/quinol oxidase subunit 2
MHFLVIKKQYLFLAIMILAILTAGTYWLLTDPAAETAAPPADQVREIHLVTGEFSATTPDGKKIEAYRWDPGAIMVDKDEKINLKIYGVNGMEHPFIIEGTDIKGTVKQGEETAVPLQFSKEGVYRLICLTHPDKDSNGPMIAYIVVD